MDEEKESLAETHAPSSGRLNQIMLSAEYFVLLSGRRQGRHGAVGPEGSRAGGRISL